MMPQHSDVEFLFVPCSPKGSNQQSAEHGKHIPWQKHASTQYHRRNKLTKSQLPHASRAARRAVRVAFAHTRVIQSKSASPEASMSESEPSHSPHDQLSPIGDAVCDQLDPFGVMIKPDTPKYAVEVLQHGIHHMWEVFNHGMSEDRIKNTILTTSMISPAAFYTIVFSAAAHNAFPHSSDGASDQIKLLRTKFQNLALSHLQQEICGLDEAPAVTDEMLLCMVILASHNEADTSSTSTHDQYMRGALVTAQNNQYHGTLAWDPAHIDVLRSLIEARGGLETVISPGVREVIAMADLLDSLKRLQEPSFLPSTRIEDILLRFPRYCDEPDLPKGFYRLRNLCELRAILKTVSYIQLVTASYQDLERQVSLVATSQDIKVASIAILHEMLSHNHDLGAGMSGFVYGSGSASSMSKSDETTRDDTISQALSHLIRYACLAYIIQVLLPLPRVTGIQAKLTAALMNTLEHFRLLDGWSVYPELTLWIAMLGGTVALGKSRLYFADVCFSSESCVRSIKSPDLKDTDEVQWSNAVKACKTFLWFENPGSPLQSDLQEFRAELFRTSGLVV